MGAAGPTAASVAAAKDLVGDHGPIRSSTAIGKLGDSEWGWIVSAAMWGWIATRSAAGGVGRLEPRGDRAQDRARTLSLGHGERYRDPAEAR